MDQKENLSSSNKERELPLGHTFAETARITSFNHGANSCARCGKTREAHLFKLPTVRIVFRGKVYDFENWQEARKRGFYLY